LYYQQIDERFYLTGFILTDYLGTLSDCGFSLLSVKDFREISKEYFGNALDVAEMLILQHLD
jgi:hypothetical protein